MLNSTPQVLKLTPAVLVSTPECVFKFINNIFNSGVGFDTGYCSLSMRHHTWLHFYRAFPGNEDLLQWNEQYFNANETAMNYTLLIVFLQKFHRKILDFCIFCFPKKYSK